MTRGNGPVPRARVNFTLPVDIIQLLDQYGKEGGNRSGLVSSLLQSYFKGEIGKNGNSAKVVLMQKRIETLSSEMGTLNSALQEMVAASKQEKSQEEDKKEEIRRKIEQWFDVDKFGGIKGWLADQERDGPNQAKLSVKRGLKVLAEKNGASLPQIISLFKEVYPSLGRLLEDE